MTNNLKNPLKKLTGCRAPFHTELKSIMTILFLRMKKGLILNGIFLQTFAYWLNLLKHLNKKKRSKRGLWYLRISLLCEISWKCKTITWHQSKILFYFFPLYIINKNCAFVKFLILVTAVNEAQEIPKDVAIRFGQLACIKLLGGESGT